MKWYYLVLIGLVCIAGCWIALAIEPNYIAVVLCGLGVGLLLSGVAKLFWDMIKKNGF